MVLRNKADSKTKILNIAYEIEKWEDLVKFEGKRFAGNPMIQFIQVETMKLTS